MERRLVWNKRPATVLRKALKRISEDSYSQAERVEAVILKNLNQARNNPEQYPPDKFKKENSGHFRAFETHSYRVAYRYNENEVRVLRIRHIKQEPKSY